jgi:ribonuclease-3
MVFHNPYRVLEKKLKLHFRDKELLSQALTHYSCFGAKKRSADGHYERLEFLGDSILGAYISQNIFKLYPDASEEELTVLRSELTSNKVLADIAGQLGLSQYVRYSDHSFFYHFSERSRDQIYADSLEAVIGAVFVDRGERRARRFIEQHILSRLDEAMRRASQDNPKSALQKVVHQRYNENPVYDKTAETGELETYRCTVGVSVCGQQLAEATGVNKKEASEQAAEKALLALLSGVEIQPRPPAEEDNWTEESKDQASDNKQISKLQ